MAGKLSLMVALVAFALSALQASAQSATDSVSIYVFTRQNETGFTDVNQQQRLQSVIDLQRMLAKKKGLAIVDDAARADVRIEVLGNERKETGTSHTTAGALAPGLGVATTKVEKQPTVLVELRVADYSLQVEGISRRSVRAADAVVDHVAKWVKANRAMLERIRATR